MIVKSRQRDGDLLSGWVNTQQRGLRKAQRTPTTPLTRGGLRFAFYGRVSTEDFQDHASSRAWQRNAANELIAGRGAIVVEFFDRG
jgi:site-specific DNA recombinase